MSASPSVFRRIEKKYRLDAAKRARIEGALSGRLAPSEADRHQVTSLYLDTPERTLVSRSMAKPLFKERLRLRAYGQAAGEALVGAFAPLGCPLDEAAATTAMFLEMKRKSKGVVSKRRLRLSLGAARAFLSGAPIDAALATWPLATEEPPAALGGPSERHQQQIARELAAFWARYPGLEPSMATRCERVAWVVPERFPGQPPSLGDDLRVTFDDHLAFCDLAPRIVEGSAGLAAAGGPGRWHSIIDARESVMEVKCTGACPLWLARELSHAGAFPCSFSKVGSATLAAQGAPGAGGRPGASRAPDEALAFRQATPWPGPEPQATALPLAAIA